MTGCTQRRRMRKMLPCAACRTAPRRPLFPGHLSMKKTSVMSPFTVHPYYFILFCF